MQADAFPVNRLNCRHTDERKYTERRFDIINGFEMIALRCLNCHKIVELTITALVPNENSKLHQF